METIFDHNVTKKEIEEFGLVGSKDVDCITANINLAYLFWHRGNKTKAKYYAEKLPVEYRNDFYRATSHP